VIGPAVAVEARAESRLRSTLLVVAILTEDTVFAASPVGLVFAGVAVDDVGTVEGPDGVAPFLGEYGLRPVGAGYIVGAIRAPARRGAVASDHVQRQSLPGESQDKQATNVTLLEVPPVGSSSCHSRA
jgi:hypothetical protein